MARAWVSFLFASCSLLSFFFLEEEWRTGLGKREIELSLFGLLMGVHAVPRLLAVQSVVPSLTFFSSWCLGRDVLVPFDDAFRCSLLPSAFASTFCFSLFD